MKNLFVLIVCLCLTVSVNAKGHEVGFNNLTLDTSNFLGHSTLIDVPAFIGDSVILHAQHDGLMGALYTGQWYFNGDSIPNSYGMHSIVVVIPQYGVYSADVIGMAYLTIVPAPLYMSIPIITTLNSCKVYPTITSSVITIDMQLAKRGDVEINISDFSGRNLKTAVYTNVAGEFKENESLEDLAGGVYFITIRVGNDVVTKKVVRI